MMKKIIVLALLTVSLFSYSQEQRTQISVNSGIFIADNYERIQLGHNFGINVSYFLTERFLLTAHWNYGQNRYYDWGNNISGQIVCHPCRLNATVQMNNVGLLVGYFHSVNQWLNWKAQIGVSQLINVHRRYPLRVYQPDPNNPNAIIHYVDNVMYSMAFPVKFDVGFTPFKRMRNIELGLTFGFYRNTNYGRNVGVYLAPQFAVSF